VTPSGASDEPVLRYSVALDRAWLCRAVQSPAVFVPQRGDSVVYLAQGHADFLALFPASAVNQRAWLAWVGAQSARCGALTAARFGRTTRSGR
jgi:hypothetical protein